MHAEQILKALETGESSDWEFKSGAGGFPGSFWPTYSGMGNTDGGAVVFGVRETENRLRIEGLTPNQLNSYQKILWDTLNNPSKVNRNLLSPHHVRVAKIGEKNLLIIQIPRAGRMESPIYIGPTPFNNTYRRCHEGEYRCNDAQVRRMLADGSLITPDQRILRGFSLQDLDPVTLDQYRRIFLTAKPDHPWHSLSLQDFLEKVGGWRKDREFNEEGLTLAGLLMFGKHHSIIDVGAAPTYFVDYREKLDPNNRWNHRIYPDGTWEANLFQFYQRIWPHLTADLKVPFYLEGVQRIDETPVHKAVREALINALIHSDYAAAGGVIVERYRDRFLLDNPGTLLVSFEQLRRGGISECRNPALQTMFMLIGGGEKAGSGIHRIQSEWKNQHWRAPAYSATDHPDRVRLVLPMVSLIPESTLDLMEKRFGSRFRSLKHLEVIALATADIEGEVTNTRLQELQTDHPADITQMLQNLCAKGMLISDYRRRWSRYRIPSSPHLTPNSPHLTQSSPHLTPHSPHLENDTLEKIVLQMANAKKISKQQMRQTIVSLCEIKELTLEALARLLKRSPKGLQNHYLTQMVAEGQLELKYPDTPNRPDQAYTAKKS
ncbi:MAG: hypothetical protein JSR58_06935 [Verrucomicrobia bacterium]|nr:hypothetical protein [Verrucomicrobiota bacterium]